MPSKNLILIYSAVVHSWAADILFPNAIFISTGVVLCCTDFGRGFPDKGSPECSSHFLSRVPCCHEKPVAKPPKNLEKSYDRYPSEQAQGPANRWQLEKRVRLIPWVPYTDTLLALSDAYLGCAILPFWQKHWLSRKILANFCQAQEACLDAREPKWRRRVPAACQSTVTIES